MVLSFPVDNSSYIQQKSLSALPSERASQTCLAFKLRFVLQFLSSLIYVFSFCLQCVCVGHTLFPSLTQQAGGGCVLGLWHQIQEFRVHELLLCVFTFLVGSSPESSVCLYNLIKLSHLTMSNCGLIQLHNLQETANCAVTFVFVLLMYYRTTQMNKEKEPTQGCSTCSPFSSAILCWLSNYRECL